MNVYVVPALLPAVTGEAALVAGQHDRLKVGEGELEVPVDRAFRETAKNEKSVKSSFTLVRLFVFCVYFRVLFFHVSKLIIQFSYLRSTTDVPAAKHA